MITIDDAPLLAVFAAVVRNGSFSAAAQELKLSKSAVSERIKQLEDRCGMRLLERTTRRLCLTDTGEDVLRAAQQFSETLHELSQQIAINHGEPSGTLRIASTHDLSVLFVAPVVARMLQKYPKVNIDIIAGDAQVDMLEAKIDIAVRLGRPKESSFIVRKLATFHEPIVAAPALAVEYQHVKHPSELASAPWVQHSLISAPHMRFTDLDGAHTEIIPWVRARGNTGLTVIQLLLSGAGVGAFPFYALREPLQDGRLVELCAGWAWKREVTLYALTPSRVALQSAARVFLQMLQEYLDQSIPPTPTTSPA